MNSTILSQLDNSAFDGCDFVVKLSSDRDEKSIRILQLTDMQVIDASQRRSPERLRPDEIVAWDPKNFDLQCGNHIRSLVTQAKPDLIIITGDIVYGSFDDSGKTFEWMCELMNSFEIPWAPVFGNHDNESAKGVEWQCEQFIKSPYCLFKRGSVSGNGNYTVGIAVGDKLVRVIHMLDTNGCYSNDKSVIKSVGLYPDQLELVASNSARIKRAQNKVVPAFMAFHIPVMCYKQAEKAKGYLKEVDYHYVIGVDVPAKDDDFGFALEPYSPVPTREDFIDFIKEQGVDGVFAGHVHNNSFCISYQGVKWVFGLKTGQYDYHIPYQLGGTLITLEGSSFFVNHLPSLVRCSLFPSKAPFFKGFFAKETDD